MEPSAYVFMVPSGRFCNLSPKSGTFIISEQDDEYIISYDREPSISILSDNGESSKVFKKLINAIMFLHYNDIYSFTVKLNPTRDTISYGKEIK